MFIYNTLMEYGMFRDKYVQKHKNILDAQNIFETTILMMHYANKLIIRVVRIKSSMKSLGKTIDNEK